MAVQLDLNQIAPGKIDVAGFREKLGAFDLEPYAGQHVQLRGCAPTWAHLMVAARLLGRVRALDFLIDDGKSGITVEVFRG
jgi:hypothetical protein